MLSALPQVVNVNVINMFHTMISNVCVDIPTNNMTSTHECAKCVQNV
jgi:hypothetical protein